MATIQQRCETTGEIPYGYVLIGGNPLVAQRPKNGLPQNQWVHVAITYDGRIITFWLNGEEVGKNEQQGKIDSAADTLYIGGRTGAAPDRHFIGLIDEVRISDEPLTPAEFFYAAVSPKSKLTTTWAIIKEGY